MADPRHALGLRAEEAVAAWLRRAGWTVLAHRVRSGAGGEVDLIVLDPDRTLVAVEVRARRSGRAGAAGWSVDRRRVCRLQATLVAFARAAGPGHRDLRVDLVTAEPDPAGPDRWRLSRLPDIGAG
jgi:putative endonuclease